MAIVRPKAIDDALALASRSGAEDGGRRLFCFAMQSRLRRRKIAGGRRCGIGDRGAAVLRPDQAIRGSVKRTRPGQPWGDTWRRTACKNKATIDSVGQRPAIAHKRRCRLTPQKGRQSGLARYCGTTATTGPLATAATSFQRLVPRAMSHRVTMIEGRSAHHPSDPAAAATNRNRYASCQMTPGVRASPYTCVRDRARRGETAMPVRAQPTSPARRGRQTLLSAHLFNHQVALRQRSQQFALWSGQVQPCLPVIAFQNHDLAVVDRRDVRTGFGGE